MIPGARMLAALLPGGIVIGNQVGGGGWGEWSKAKGFVNRPVATVIKLTLMSFVQFMPHQPLRSVRGLVAWWL